MLTIQTRDPRFRRSEASRPRVATAVVAMLAVLATLLLPASGAVAQSFTLLGNGAPASGISAGQDGAALFAIDVPDGASDLTFTITGGSGDADLYVRPYEFPTGELYQCRPYLGGNEETCFEQNPVAARWYVGIVGYTAYADVTLTASFSTSGSANQLQNGVWQGGLSGAAGEWVDLFVDVPVGATGLRFETDGGSGDADLYVRRLSLPTENEWDCRPYATGNREICDVTPQAGRWYVSLLGYENFSGVNLLASWSGGSSGTGSPQATPQAPSPQPPTSGYTMLANDATASGLSGTSGARLTYAVDVPAAASRLSVIMDGGFGDADLYVRYGAEPTDALWDCRPYLDGNGETCDIANPQAGRWYVTVVGYQTFGDLNLTVSHVGSVGARVGISTGSQIDAIGLPEVDIDLDMIDNLGVGWVRFDLNWRQIEPVQGQYEWSFVDHLVNGANARNLDVLLTIAYAPDWAIDFSRPVTQSPFDVNAFRTFTAAAAARYGPLGVRAFEIWNEPNVVDFWGTTPNVQAYGELLAAAAQGIRSVDPGATILNGGLAPAATTLGSTIDPTSFVQQMFGLGLDQWFDAVSMHPYSFPLLPSEPSPTNAFYQLTNLHNWLEANGGEGMQIWATEFGAPTGTHPRSLSPELQRDIVLEGVRCHAALDWLGPLFVYQHRDQVNGSDAELDDNFGLAYEDRSPKPVWWPFVGLMGEPAQNQGCPLN